MGAWILASFLLCYCSFVVCSYEVEEPTDDLVTESVMPYGHHVRDQQSSERHAKPFKPSKKLYTLVARSSQGEFQTVGTDDTAEVIYNDVVPFATDSYDVDGEPHFDNQELKTLEGKEEGEDQIPSGSYIPQPEMTYHLADSPKSPNQKEVHYHQHKHLHEHEHKQEHLHKHDQEHAHSHDHGHKHESRHHHDQHSFHEHQHHGVHHHAHESAHHHDHRGTHRHSHKGDHKHGHHHQQKHRHQSQHKHEHQHQGKHNHLHKSEHRNEHKHEHTHHGKHSHQHHRGSGGSKGRSRRYGECGQKTKRELRRGCRRRLNETNGTKY